MHKDGTELRLVIRGYRVPESADSKAKEANCSIVGVAGYLQNKRDQ